MNGRSWLLMVGTAALWGASYLFIKVALDDFSEGAIVCIRTALGAVLLLAIAGGRGKLSALRGRLGWVAAIAMIQVVGPFLLITYGENHIATSLTAVLIATVPIFTALLAIRFDHAERSHGWGLAGIAIGIVGVGLLFGVDLSGDADELIAGGMMLLAALGYAISWMLAKHRLAGAPADAVAGGTMLVAALVTAPLLAAGPPAHAPAPEAIGALLALGLGGTGVAFVLYYALIVRVGPARASMVGYIAPAFSILYGMTLLGEPLTVGGLGGLALILVGSWLGAEGRLPWQPQRPRPGVGRPLPADSAPSP